MATIEAVTDVLDFLVRNKPGAPKMDVDEFEKTAQAWYVTLEPLCDEVVMQAAVVLAREKGDYLPSSGTLYNYCLDLMDDQPSADDAWALVDRYRHHASLGVNNPVKLPDRAMAALRAMGGNCGMWLEDDIAFRRREFLEAYGNLRARWKRESALALPAGEGRRLLGG